MIATATQRRVLRRTDDMQAWDAICVLDYELDPSESKFVSAHEFAKNENCLTLYRRTFFKPCTVLSTRAASRCIYTTFTIGL